MSDQIAVVMLDELAKGDVLSTALRVICNPEESRGAVEDGEYKLAVADILSIGEYHKSIFLDIYKEFESVGAMVFDYNLKWWGVWKSFTYVWECCTLPL